MKFPSVIVATVSALTGPRGIKDEGHGVITKNRQIFIHSRQTHDSLGYAILTHTSVASDWIEPDEVARPVVTYGIASNQIGTIELDMHCHAKGQIMLVQRGALSCRVEYGLWIVPPRSAVWIPGGTPHAVRATGSLEGYSAFVAADIDAGLPQRCCTVSVTPLLRELLFRAARLPLFFDEGGANSRLMALLLDEIATAEVEDLHLPMPADPRLRILVDLMMAAPAERGSLHGWAKRAGLSERTMERLIQRETGMSFGRWRQQLGVMLAVQWLAGGGSIQQVAADLGYESVPSFVTLFRKTLGTSPGRYMAERYARRPAISLVDAVQTQHPTSALHQERSSK